MRHIPSPIKARIQGLGIVAGACIWFALNEFRLSYDNRYYPAFVLVGLTFGGFGLWRLVVGEPIDPRSGKPAKWAVNGMFIAGSIGFAWGLVEMFLAKWE